MFLCAAILSFVLHVIVSLLTQRESDAPKQAEYTWIGLGIFTKHSLKVFAAKLGITLVLFAILGYSLWQDFISPAVIAAVASLWTWAMFLSSAIKFGERQQNLLKDDRIWGGLLAACAVFMLFYFK